MKVSMNFQCLGCETDNSMRFQKPTAFSQATCFVTCKECSSKFTVLIKKPPMKWGVCTYKAIPEFISPKAHAFQLKKQADLKARAMEV